MENAQAYLRIVDYAGNDTISGLLFESAAETCNKTAKFCRSRILPGQEYFIEFGVSNGDFRVEIFSRLN